MKIEEIDSYQKQRDFLDPVFDALDDANVDDFCVFYDEATRYYAEKTLIKRISNFIHDDEKTKKHMLRFLLKLMKDSQYWHVLPLIKAIKLTGIKWTELDTIENSLRAENVIKERADDNGNTKCWKGYRKVGLKKKGGKMVNDCRPIKK